MAKYKTFLYHSGVLYGFSTTIDSVSPPDGPSTGGNPFVIIGSGFDPRQWDDLFTGAVLDPLKWVNINAGTGTLSTGASHLHLYTGLAPGSVAGIESIFDFVDTQAEISVTVPRIVQYPASDVTLVALSLYVNVNNHVTMSMKVDAINKSVYMDCVVTNGGSIVESKRIDWTFGISSMKILRWKSEVYFIANGSVIFRSKNFVPNLAKFRVYSTNLASAYDINNVVVELFYYRTFVVFDDQVVHDTVTVSDVRVRGIVPPSLDYMFTEAAYAGLVDVSVVGASTNTKSNAYEYYYINGLKVINSTQFDTRLSLIGDTTLNTPVGSNKGLGGGS